MHGVTMKFSQLHVYLRKVKYYPKCDKTGLKPFCFSGTDMSFEAHLRSNLKLPVA